MRSTGDVILSTGSRTPVVKIFHSFSGPYQDVYSKFSFDYPYPVAISVNAWESGGMEYPMITFNGYRPVEDEDTGERTYSRRAKYGLISGGYSRDWAHLLSHDGEL